MRSLADALKSFNRKERNLLIHAMLAKEGHLPLSKSFRDEVAKKLDFAIPEGAWWATDYHFSWLAGALARFVKDAEETAQEIIWPNPENEDVRRLVERNQEDVDLVIATGCNLVFIEANAYGYFDNAQLKHKLERLELLHKFYIEIVGTNPPPNQVVHFYFLIISPCPPTEKLTACWPSWACKGQDVPWIPLQLTTTPVFLVTQCDEQGTSSDAGQFWRVKPARAIQATPDSCES